MRPACGQPAIIPKPAAPHCSIRLHCWVDFEIGDRSAATFDRLYRRLPEAELYRTDAYTDAYGVYGSLPADQGLYQKRGDFGVFGGVALWEMAAKIQ